MTDDRAVILAEDRCRIELADQTVGADARIVFRPHRFPSAVVEVAGLEITLSEDVRVSLVLESSSFVLHDGTLEAFSSAIHPPNSRFRDRVRQTDPMSLQRPGRVSAVECIVYNLSRFGFRGGPSNGLEQLELNIPGGWRATIGPLASDLRHNRELLELLGNSWRRPTNTLNLFRTDSGDTSVTDIRETLFLLRYFLSFAWGRNIGIGLAQGFAENGDLVYAEPGMTRVDAWADPAARGQSHWFPPSQAEILEDVLPGFWNRMRDPEWKDCVDWALYWWLSANRSGQFSETSILASQAGLEAVAPRLLQHFGISKSEAERRGQAAAKIRRMLTKLRVPLTIPGQLGELREMAAPRSWDGPQALTKVRNALVHPAKGDEVGLAFEASQLGMWYLELVLLFLFGYHGKIFNRTVFAAPWFEQETVPWSQPRSIGDAANPLPPET